MAQLPVVADPYCQDAAELARLLEVNVASGLTAGEAATRLRQEGPNALQAAPEIPAWRQFLTQFQDPLVYLLLGAVLVTLMVWVIEGMREWPVDALVIVVIVILNAVLGFVQESRSQRAAAALARMTATTALVLRDGVKLKLPVTEVVRGDILLLSEGDSVAADARLLQANLLRVQEASLTGESEAVWKSPEPLAATVPLAERHNMVFKGTAVAQGTALAVVTATGMQTEMGAIARLLAATAEEATPLQKEVRQIGRTLGRAVILIAVVVVVAVLLVSEVDSLQDWINVLLLGVSLAVAAVPEGLPAIMSLVLALGVQRMAERNAIVKKLSSVETLGSTSVICSDKTGTLTRSEMTIERVMTASGCVRVSGVGYAPVGGFSQDDQPLAPGPLQQELTWLLGGGALAGNAELRQGAGGQWEILGDPTEAAFMVAERKLAVDGARLQRFRRVGEIPFTSDRKMMSVVLADEEPPGQRLLVSKGAPDVLLARCTRIQVGEDAVALDAIRRAAALADVDTLSGDALRTLSVAWRRLGADEEVTEGLEQDLVFVGTAGIIDPPRPEAAEAIAQAHRAGIRVVMITGDHPRTASRIAADLGIAAPGQLAMSGAEIDALDDAGLARAAAQTSVYARVAPVHKLRIVDALQGQGQVVAMTGDGVNDAPALKAADIGVAMGITGTEVTREAGKMILADDNFATIVVAVQEGRGILDNIRKFLRYLLSSNIGEVLTVFLAVVGAGVIGLVDASGAVVLPLLATQILWINLVTDAAPALAMGVDPQDEGVMARKPRGVSERLINRSMWWNVATTGLVMALCCLATFDLLLPGGMIAGSASLETARTCAFTVLVLAQLFNAFCSRSESRSAFAGLFSNRWLWGAVLLGVALQVAVVELAWLNHAFGTVPLDAAQWGVCALLASGVLWFSEARKWWLRSTADAGDRHG